MDLYTDTRGHGCGCRQGRRSWEGHNGCGPSWGNMAAPYAADTWQQPFQMSCPTTQAGMLEQNYPVAMAYVPWQQWQNTYAPERGLAQGTIFPDLDLPFVLGRCSR